MREIVPLFRPGLGSGFGTDWLRCWCTSQNGRLVLKSSIERMGFRRMGYVTTRKLMALCRLGVRRAAESSGAADDTVDFGGMSRQRKQLFTLTLEFIAGWQDLRACLRD